MEWERNLSLYNKGQVTNRECVLKPISMCGGFIPHQQEILWHQLGVLHLLNSETMYLKTASDPAGEELSPIRLPHSTSDAIYKHVCASDWLYIRSPHDLFLRFD